MHFRNLPALPFPPESRKTNQPDPTTLLWEGVRERTAGQHDWEDLGFDIRVAQYTTVFEVSEIF
jgi:hypothetical protein